MAVLPFGLWDIGESFNQAVDYEEEEQDQYEIEDINEKTLFQFITSDKNSLSAENLIISCSEAANSFLDIYFDLPKQPIAELALQTVDSDSVAKQKRDKRHCLFYKVKNSLICVSNLIIKQEDCLACIEQILANVNCNKVSILSSLPKSNFHGNQAAEKSDMDFLRSLSSSKFVKDDVRVIGLEQGNLVENLPAAALSYCEQFQIPCILYVSYTESHYIDVFSLKTYESIVNEDILSDLPKASMEVLTNRLKSFEGIGVADNNLYI